MRPFHLSIPTGAYGLRIPAERGRSPAADAFADWLEAEMAAFRTREGLAAPELGYPPPTSPLTRAGG